MKVYFIDPQSIRSSASAHERGPYLGMVASASADRVLRHEQTIDPDRADLIIAGIQGDGYGAHFQDLRASRFYQDYRQKLICYCSDDMVYPALPGIYPAATPYWASRRWAVGGHYISAHIRRHDFDQCIPAEQRNYLFSFVGSSWTNPIRERVLSLQHDRASLEDSAKTSESAWYFQGQEVMESRYAKFKTVLNHTKFALCPRGLSASSIRLFEAMQAGCVPVLIADDIVFPEGPQWEAFCVRIPESDVVSVPKILESVEADFEVKGKLARAAWEEFFSPTTSFDSLVEWGARIILALSPAKRRRLERQVRVGEYIIPANLRTHGRHAVRRWRTRFSHSRR